MPRTWHDRHIVNKMDNETDKLFYRSIVADKKPYFMRYIYPALMKQYKTYIKNTNRNALREFQMTVEELQTLPHDELTERQRDFLEYYEYRMPVGTGDCVMNKICRRFEEEFDGYIGKYNAMGANFDYSIMRSDTEYTTSQFYAVKKLYEEYNKHLQNYKVFAQYERIDKWDSLAALTAMNNTIREECDKICPNEFALGNIVLDMCYKRSSTKKFAWGMGKDIIIHNLLRRNDNLISFPTMDSCGEFSYGGNSYTVNTKELEVV